MQYQYYARVFFGQINLSSYVFGYLDNRQMGKFKSCVYVILLLSTNVFAGEIYKWTDENGKAHFGDQSNAPKQSQEVVVKPVNGTGSMPNKYNFTTKDQPKNTIANTKRSNAPDLESPAVGRCLVLAKKYIVNDDAEREALIAKIKSMCRGVSFSCESHKANPDRNSCSAAPARLDGATVEYSVNRE